MRRASWIVAVTVGLLGCEPEVGECTEADFEQAIRVAYDQASGYPAYEGQALMISSCGNGGFCHGASPDEAYGVPEGLHFDVQLAGIDGRVDEREVARQRRGRFRVVQEGRLILHTVDLGTMPPPPNGDDVREVLESAPIYVRAGEDGFEELPGVDTADGREILRNWLACQAPVIERPVPREDMVPAVVVPPDPRTPIEPTWTSIFDDLLRARGCATASCHGGSDAGFVVTDMAGTHAAIVGTGAGSEECAGNGTLVTAGDPSSSLFLEKLRANPICGERMPLRGLPISDADIAAVSQWIADGAMMN